MISEKGLCKILKSAYKNGGYSVIQVRRKVESTTQTWQRNEIILNGATWAVRCVTEDLPKAAAVQIVEDVGYMPMDAVTVQKNQPNQTMLDSIADTRSESLEGLNAGGVRMRQIPVIFRERWQLYQTEEGKVYAFDLELLKLINFKEAEPLAFMSGNGHLGIFFWGDSTVYIAPGRFSRANEEKILYIAGLDWENQIDMEDPVANASLFDEDRDEPLVDREE